MSAKNKDNQNRWKKKAVVFRMSPEESAQLDAYVRLSGLSRQNYLIRRCLRREVTVIGSPRVYKALRGQLREVLDQLKRIDSGCCVDSDLLDVIRQIAVNRWIYLEIFRQNEYNVNNKLGQTNRDLQRRMGI